MYGDAVMPTTTGEVVYKFKVYVKGKRVKPLSNKDKDKLTEVP
jgi:hypothetical protein